GALAEAGEPEAREDPGAGEPATAEDEVAGADERRLRRAHPGQLEGEIRLDRGGRAARPVVINRPAPVRLLERQQPLRQAPLDVGPLAAEQAIEEDVLGLHGGVRLERRMPVAARVLRGEEILAGARD